MHTAAPTARRHRPRARIPAHSTPPSTQEGCGHWGLLAVEPSALGTGVASALVAAAEARLAGACDQIQIEYEYTAEHAPSQRLRDWYEGRLGFVCVSGHGRYRAATEFRKCRKEIPSAVARRARLARLRDLREMVAADLADADAHAPTLRAGSRVRLGGLESKPEMNGVEGVAVEVDDESGRWTVELADGRRVALRPANLVIVGEGEEEEDMDEEAADDDDDDDDDEDDNDGDDGDDDNDDSDTTTAKTTSRQRRR